MIRFLICCVFYTTVSRWGYSEIAVMFPDVVPYLNYVIEKVQIPTHHHWSVEAFEGYVDEAKFALADARDTLEGLKDTLRDVKRG